MILPRSSPKYLRPFFLLSFFLCFSYKTVVKNSLSTKPLNQLQNDITFAVVLTLTVANWQVWQLWLATKFSTQHHYEMTKSSKVQTCPLHMHAPHVNTSCVLFLRWLYLNLCQIIIWWLTTIKKNFCQPVLCLDLLWLCHQEAWLSFMTCRTCTLTTLLSDSKTKVLVHGATARPWPTWLSSSSLMTGA